MADFERSPPIEKVIQRHVLAALDELHTCLPGVVTDYDATTQRASVKPLVKHAYLDEQGNRQVLSLAVIPGVPVQFMAAGGFALTCPISTGLNGLGAATTGLLIFAEDSLDSWLSGAGQEVDPGIDHRHALTDAVFIPGLQPFGAPLTGVPTDHAVLGAVGGVQAHFRKTGITLGDEATAGFVALAAKVGNQFTGFSTALTAAITASTNAGNATGAAALTALQTALAALPGGWPSSTAATQAKAT